MNKKFLSAILFGALMVTSTGTFVSCKDYDSDIEELWDAVGGKASADDLKNQIDSMKNLLSDAQTAANAASTAADAAKKAADEALAKAQSAEDKAAAEAANVEAIAKQEAAAAQAAAIAAAKEEVSALEKELNEALNKKVDQSAFNELIAKVANLQEVVETIAGKQLKSLVFVPQLYMDGVEGFETPYMPYFPWGFKAYDGKDGYAFSGNGLSYVVKNYEVESLASEQKNVVVINPTKYVDYHMNPTTAKVADFKDNLSFVSRDLEFIGRAAKCAPVATYKAHDNKTGLLTVGVKLNGTKVMDQAPLTGEFDEAPFIYFEEPANDADTISVLALQADVKGAEVDTTVTSDYAGLYASMLKVQSITHNPKAASLVSALKDCYLPNKGGVHVYTDIKDVILNPATVKVAYNSTLDLNTVVEAHYFSNSETGFGNNQEVKVWANGEEAAYNLAYEYDLVHYTAGTNKTSESLHVKLNKSVITPVAVDKDGNQLNAGSIEIVGREPLVRVKMIDTENNKVVKYGYIKLVIVETETPKETVVFDKGNFYYSCIEDYASDYVQNVKLTWSETQAELLRIAGTSKETFHLLYELETVNGAAVQYDKNYKQVSAIGEKNVLPYIVGQITEVTDPEAPTTTCLKWSVLHDDFVNLRAHATVDNSAKTIKYTHTVYVKYVGKGTANSGVTKTPIYVPIKVTFNYPYGTLNNKLATKWYAANSLNAGYDEIHVNVEVPATTVKFEDEGTRPASIEKFRSDLDAYFMVNKTKGHAVTNPAEAAVVEGDAPTFGVAKEFTEWEDKDLAYKYYFTFENDYRTSGETLVGEDGTKYHVYTVYNAYPNKWYSQTAWGATGEDWEKHVAAVSDNYDMPYLSGEVTGNSYDNYTRDYNVTGLNVVKLDADGKEIGGLIKLATIDNKTGIIEYADNDDAKNLLNYVGHKDLKNTITVNIGVAAFNPCAQLLPLVDKTFDAKFLRPVDIEQGVVKNFTDAVDGTVESTEKVNGAWAYVFNMVKLSDWRDQLFVTETALTDGKNLNYFDYYQVEEIEVNVADIKTDMAGDWKKLSDVNKSIYFEYAKGSGDIPVKSNFTATKDKSVEVLWYEALEEYYGTVKYFNNTGNTAEFNVQIPVTVTYKWGEITIWIECHVGGTLNN